MTKVKLGQQEIDLNELANFLVVAKRNGYAGGEGKVREADGSKTFTYQEGNFHYTDNYAGSDQAPGNEIVRWQRVDGQRVWYMAYSGGMLREFWGDKELADETYRSLKKALGQVTAELPFRGPIKLEDDKSKYVMQVQGNIERFLGEEAMTNKKLNRIVFSQDFMGGLVVPK